MIKLSYHLLILSLPLPSFVLYFFLLPGRQGAQIVILVSGLKFVSYSSTISFLSSGIVFDLLYLMSCKDTCKRLT